MPQPLKSKIFIDGGDPQETAAAKKLLGYLDGQTTNPTLVAKNPEIKDRIEKGKKFTLPELLTEYKKIIKEIEKTTPTGAISIEVYADSRTKPAEIIKQAREFTTWAENSYIKIPIIQSGLAAAEVLSQEMRLNFTLCFSQEQAAAVYAVTRGSPYTHFVSPFVGRLDDRGENGIDLIKNILQMYSNSQSQVEVLTASVRHLNHLLEALKIKSPAITLPFKVFQQWAEVNFSLPSDDFNYESSGAPIVYQDIPLDKPWQQYNLEHPLTTIGLKKFADDWNKLLK